VLLSASLIVTPGPQVPLSETTDISLLESVIGNQTLILQTVYNTTDVSVIPQIWTLCQFQLISVCFFFMIVHDFLKIQTKKWKGTMKMVCAFQIMLRCSGQMTSTRTCYI
jgi:hypothetical protein